MPLRQFVDPGGELYLPFAKKKLGQMHAQMIGTGVARLERVIFTDAATNIFLRSIRAAPAVFIDTVRITGGSSYLVAVTMPDTTPYRSLFLDTITFDPALSFIRGIVGSSGPVQIPYIITETIQDSVGGILYSVTTGTETGSPSLDGAGTGTLTIARSNFTNNSAGALTVQNGTVVFNVTGFILGSSTGSFVTSSRPARDAAAAYAASISINQLQVTMSDGTVLATRAQTTSDGGASYQPTFSGAWLGEEGTLLSDGSTLAFTVPADTQSALAGATAVAREKARLQTNSTNALNLLRAGVMPNVQYRDAWDKRVKANAPASALPRQVVPFTAVVSDVTTISTPTVTQVTRTAVLSYGDQQETLVGTATTENRSYTKSGSGTIFSAQYTFSNFPCFNSTGAQSGLPLDVTTSSTGITNEFYADTTAQVFKDGSFGIPVWNLGMGVVANGGATAGYNADSSTCSPSSFTGAPSDPSAFYGYSPAYPAANGALTFTTAPLFTQYLADVKPVSVDTLPDPKPAYSSNWLSTSMVPGEVVSLIPFSPVLSGEDLGMFASHVGATQVATHGYATFRYNIDGSFTFVSWHDNPKVTDMLDSAGAAITWPSTNCVVKYTKFGWKDTQALATAQALALNAPVTQANKFLKLIKQAQGI